MRGWSTVTGLCQWRAHPSRAGRDRLAMPLLELLGGLLAPPLCWSCSGLVARGELLCRGCRLALHRLAAEPVWLAGVRVWAPVAYSGPARDLVRALKFRGAVHVADAMAAQIVANAPEPLPELDSAAGRPTLVPVPLHPRRLRSRGYNQAAAIADALSRRTSIPLTDCLARTASRSLRWAGIEPSGRRVPSAPSTCWGSLRPVSSSSTMSSPRAPRSRPAARRSRPPARSRSPPSRSRGPSVGERLDP
jgi:hypothetical protein